MYLYPIYHPSWAERHSGLVSGLQSLIEGLVGGLNKKHERKAQNTLLEQIASQIEGPYQMAQAMQPGITPYEQSQQGIVTGIAPEEMALTPTVGTPEGAQANRYAQIPPGSNQFVNPGVLANILRNTAIPPEMRLQSLGLMGDLRNLIMPQRKLGRPFPTKSGEYMTMDEQGNVIPLGVEAPEKETKETKTKMNKWNPRLNAFQEVDVPESQVEAMQQQGWEMGGLKFRPEKGEKEAGEDKSDIRLNRQIEKYSKAINITLKRYGGSGGITIDFAAASRGEDVMGDQDKSAYSALRKKAEGGDPQAKKDLAQVDFWYSKINELTGVAPAAPATSAPKPKGKSPAVTKFLEKYR